MPEKDQPTGFVDRWRGAFDAGMGDSVEKYEPNPEGGNRGTVAGLVGKGALQGALAGANAVFSQVAGAFGKQEGAQKGPLTPWAVGGVALAAAGAVVLLGGGIPMLIGLAAVAGIGALAGAVAGGLKAAKQVADKHGGVTEVAKEAGKDADKAVFKAGKSALKGLAKQVGNLKDHVSDMIERAKSSKGQEHSKAAGLGDMAHAAGDAFDHGGPHEGDEATADKDAGAKMGKGSHHP